MIKKRTLFVILALASMVKAQAIDTTQVKQLHALESQIDSLRRVIKILDKELQNVKQNLVEGKSDIDELLALLNNEDEEAVESETRSRYRRVDALLKAITQRPGVLQLNGGTTTIIQSGFEAKDNHTTVTGSMDIFAHTAFGPNTLLFFDLEAIGGNGPDVFFPNLFGLNGDAGSTQDEDGVDRLTVLEAWAEFTILNQMFTITTGKIDLTNYFDNNSLANDETMQFISNAFVNSAAFAVPANAPGIRIRTNLLQNYFNLQFGFSNVRNVGDNAFENVYKIASIAFMVPLWSEHESNIRIYGYQHPLANNALGWGISYDSELLEAISIFARYGQNEKSLADFWGVRSAWSFGARYKRKILGKNLVFGIAFGNSKPAAENLKTEKLMELFARQQLNKWTYLSPHFQLVWNAAGTSKTVAVFGMRTQFNF